MYAEQISMGFCPKDVWERMWQTPQDHGKLLKMSGSSISVLFFFSPISDTCQSHSRETILKVRKLKRGDGLSFGLRCLSYRWKEAGNLEMQSSS